MFKEASVYALKKLSPEQQQTYGLRVLAMRKWPRSIKRGDIDLWVPTAGPSTHLLTALHSGALSWEAFIEQYTDEQLQQQSCRVVTYPNGQPVHQEFTESSLAYLQNLGQVHPVVTILCWEAEGQPCHRYTLLRLLQGKASDEER